MVWSKTYWYCDSYFSFEDWSDHQQGSIPTETLVSLIMLNPFVFHQRVDKSAMFQDHTSACLLFFKSNSYLSGISLSTQLKFEHEQLYLPPKRSGLSSSNPGLHKIWGFSCKPLQTPTKMSIVQLNPNILLFLKTKKSIISVILSLKFSLFCHLIWWFM